MEIRRGEIWLINPGYTIGHEMRKVRPALIVQNDTGNKYGAVTVVVPITTADREKVYPFEVTITLKKPSRIQCNHIRSIDKLRLIKKIGTADTATMMEVNEALKIVLDIL